MTGVGRVGRDGGAALNRENGGAALDGERREFREDREFREKISG